MHGIADATPMLAVGIIGRPSTVTGATAAAPSCAHGFDQCWNPSTKLNLLCCDSDKFCKHYQGGYYGNCEPRPPLVSQPWFWLIIVGSISLLAITLVTIRCMMRRRPAIAGLHSVSLLRSTVEGADPDTFAEGEFVKVLGRGSSGVVSLMRIRPAGADQPPALVVCKVLNFDDFGGVSEGVVPGAAPPEQFTDAPEELYEMWHEVRVLSQMQHPHIIRYLHARRHLGQLRIYMEYADGGSLAAAMRARNGRPLATERAVQWTRELASALQHVHAQGVLHRDLKTQNVFLTASHDIKLGDFGVSRHLSTHTHFANTMVGTPFYLAPEVLRATPYAFAADVWSLGVILFELLTLTRPFDAPHLATLVTKIETAGYDDGALARCVHPPELRRLASRECLLHVDASERMRIDELLEALGEPPNGDAPVPRVAAVDADA